jgi:hypothetical protein
MFAVDPCAVRVPHGLAKSVPPTVPAAHSISALHNAASRQFASERIDPSRPAKQHAIHAHTVTKASHLVSAHCAFFLALFPGSASQLPCFQSRAHSFVKTPGVGCSAQEVACAQRVAHSAKRNCRRERMNQAKRQLPQLSNSARMRDPRLCVIVSVRAHVLARPVAPVTAVAAVINLNSRFS